MGGKNSKAKKATVQKPELKPDVKKETKKETAKIVPTPVLPQKVQETLPPKGNVLIVFASSEPNSFCSAMKNTIVDSLKKVGYAVQISDLYAMKFFDSLDKTDFTKLEDPAYFKPQAEQTAANRRNFLTYSAEIKQEHEKVKACDIMIFVFPLYWWGFPGIMKNWIDRVLSMGFAYGAQGAASLKGKKAMVLYATGGTKNDHEASGMEEAAQKMMHKGIFAFCGITPLQPFVAYHAPWVEEEVRKKYLAEISQIMLTIEKRGEYKME